MTQRQGNYNGKPYMLEHFESIDEFLTTIEGRKFQGNYKHDSDLKNDTYCDSSFRGVSGYSEAKKQFIEGTKAKSEMARAYTAMQTSRRRETVNAPCGGAPIVAAALLGLPDSMIDTRRKREPKTARVIVNMSIACRTSAADITEAGKKIIAAVGKLDGEGISTEIICSADSCLNGRSLSSCGVRIKTAGQGFSAARVSFSMSSPAFLRVFQFIHKATKPGLPYDYSYGHSVAYEYSGKALDEYYRAMYGNGIYISLKNVVEDGQREIDRAINAWKAGQ